MNEPWYLRHDYDRRIKEAVYDNDEYGLPADLRGWTVLDLGGNIGSFARLAAERGAVVHSYEPCPDNARLLLAHTQHVRDRVKIAQAAVLGDCGPEGCTSRVLVRRDDPAGHNLFGGHASGLEVPVVSIAVAVASAGGHVDLCKIDAEGAEYDILENGDLSGIRRLAVEFHGGYVGSPCERAEALRESLARQGFRETCWEATHVGLGWYRLYKGERA